MPLLFVIYTDWLARKQLFAALGVKDEDMQGVGEVGRMLNEDEVEPVATDPVERRRQIEAFVTAAGGDI